MGGRGAKSNKKPQSLFKGINLDDIKKKKPAKELPKTGKQVHSEFIKHFKGSEGVDLSVARDTQFDDRNGFNIDTRKLSVGDWYKLNHYISSVNKKGLFKAVIIDNGAYRRYIRVKRA